MNTTLLLSRNYRKDLIEWAEEQGKPIPPSAVMYKASLLGTSSGELAKVLHYLGYTPMNYVPTASKVWNLNDEEELIEFIRQNEKKLTFEELAKAVCGGKYSTRQITGKTISLGLQSLVKSRSYHKYSDEETKYLIKLLKLGCTYYQIVAETSRSIKSISTKLGCMRREGTPVDELIENPEGFQYETEHLLLSEIARLHKISTTLTKQLLRQYKLDCIDYKGTQL